MESVVAYGLLASVVVCIAAALLIGVSLWRVPSRMRDDTRTVDEPLRARWLHDVAAVCALAIAIVAIGALGVRAAPGVASLFTDDTATAAAAVRTPVRGERAFDLRAVREYVRVALDGLRPGIATDSPRDAASAALRDAADGARRPGVESPRVVIAPDATRGSGAIGATKSQAAAISSPAEPAAVVTERSSPQRTGEPPPSAQSSTQESTPRRHTAPRMERAEPPPPASSAPARSRAEPDAQPTSPPARPAAGEERNQREGRSEDRDAGKRGDDAAPPRPDDRDRGESGRRGDRFERLDRDDRRGSRDRPERLERFERAERPERLERRERAERPERRERGERRELVERLERRGR